MNANQYWIDAWEKKETPWNYNEPNRYLIRYFSSLGLNEKDILLVPLCGNSLDLIWLAKQKVSVLGIEISQRAIENFFDGNQIAYKKIGNVYLSLAPDYEIKIINTDIFTVNINECGDVKAIYDNAALITFSTDKKSDYINHLFNLAPNAKLLVVTCCFKKSINNNGLPFFESLEALKSLYTQRYGFRWLKEFFFEKTPKTLKRYKIEKGSIIVALLYPYKGFRPISLYEKFCFADGGLCLEKPKYGYENHSYCAEHFPTRFSKTELANLISYSEIQNKFSLCHNENMNSESYYLYNEYGIFGFPTAESIQILSFFIKTKTVYDLGCGVGYLSYALKKLLPKKQIYSYDYGKIGRQKYGLSKFHCWVDIIDKDVITENISISNATIIINWPDTQNDFAYNVCQRHIENNVIIYIGESDSGRTASSKFFKYFDIVPLPIPWHSFHSTQELVFLVRRKTIGFNKHNEIKFMSLSEMNAALMQIYTNDIYRDYFFKNKKDALAFFSMLSDDEKEALMSLPENEIREFSDGLRIKLMQMVKRYYETLFNYNLKLFSSLFDRFYLNRKLANFEGLLDYGIYFGEYLKESIQELDLPDYLYDVARFYNQKLRAKHITYPAYKINSKPITAECLLMLSPHIHMHLYDYNMIEVINTLALNADYKKSDHAYLMYNIDGELKIEHLSMAMYTLLNFCNGTHTMREIIDKMLAVYSEEIKSSLNIIINDLLEKNYIFIR